MSEFFQRVTTVETKKEVTHISFEAHKDGDKHFTVVAMPSATDDDIFVTAYICYLAPTHTWSLLDDCGRIVPFREMASAMENMWSEAAMRMLNATQTVEG